MKRLVRLALICLTVLFCTVFAHAEGSSVTSMEVSAVLDRYGNAAVTMTAVLQFDEAQDAVLLPLGENVRGISLQGGDFSTDSVEGGTVLSVKNSAGTVGEKTYTVQFTKTKNVTAAEDGTQVLDMELLCPLWDCGVQQLSFSVTLPREFSASPVFRSGYYGEDLAVSSTVEGAVISGSVQTPLLDRESVDLTLSLPAGYFRVLHAMGNTALWDAILIGILTVLGAVYWYLTLRNPQPRRQARKLSPDGVSAWEFPYVLSCGTPDAALLVSEWASLGYLSIHLTARGRVLLTGLMPMYHERRRSESKAFDALFRRGDTCHGDTPRFREIGCRAAAAAKRFWNRRLFARDSGNVYLLRAMASVAFGLTWLRAADLLIPAWRLRSLLLAPILALGVVCGWFGQAALQNLARKGQDSSWPLIPALVFSAFLAQFGGGWLFALLGLALLSLSAAATYRGGKRSRIGLELIGQADAFRRYLRSSDTHHLQLMLHADSQYFYDLLPYAEALGMGRAFARRFANIQLEPCAWLTGDRLRYQTAAEFYAIYRTVLGKMRGLPGKGASHG